MKYVAYGYVNPAREDSKEQIAQGDFADVQQSVIRWLDTTHRGLWELNPMLSTDSLSTVQYRPKTEAYRYDFLNRVFAWITPLDE